MTPTRILALAGTTPLLVLALLGCGASSEAMPVAAPDFSYQPQEQHEDTGLTIATVEPDMVDPDVIAPEPPAETPPFAVTADGYTVEAQMQIGLMRSDETSKGFRALFEEKYVERLQSAANDAISKILRHKGFAVQPVASYDEVVGDGNEQGFLTSLPNYTLGIGNKDSATECANNICTQTGKLLIDGQYLYQMAEPHTGTTVAYRRMNLYGLRIEEPYKIQTWENDPDALTRVKQWFGFGQNLVDTSEQALAAGVTKLYQQTMAETERTISRPQILALKQTIDRLKHSDPQ